MNRYNDDYLLSIANQWTFIENSNKRPDVILFLNGLPVVLVELKSPSREKTDASEAYRQLRDYMQEIPSMFIYNAICVMSDQLTFKAGTITSGGTDLQSNQTFSFPYSPCLSFICWKFLINI